MRTKLDLALGVDMAMLGCLLAGLAYPLTGNVAHELTGLLFFGLCGFHTFLNRKWYCTIRRKPRSPRQKLNTAINLTLVALMVFFIASSVLQSATLFPFFLDTQTLTTRKLHTTLAWWGFILVGVHVGGHWNRVFGVVRQWMSRVGQNRWASMKLVSLPLLFAYGVHVFMDRGLTDKLLGLTSFENGNVGTAAVSYIAGYAAMFSVCAGLTHYGLRLCNKYHQK